MYESKFPVTDMIHPPDVISSSFFITGLQYLENL